MARKALTTGEVARYCGVNFRTVIRWIERGNLRAYKLPGRGDNRVEVSDFLDFLRRYGIPVPPEFRASNQQVLVVESNRETVALIEDAVSGIGFSVETAGNTAIAGFMMAIRPPAAIIICLDLLGPSPQDTLKSIREMQSLAEIKILLLCSSSNAELAKACWDIVDNVLIKPIDQQELTCKLRDLICVGH